ncbi:MAG: serine/threonine-protein kinase [Thermoanaerobaculia bacterium]|jgi:serine/threonine-protein kinase
MHAEEAVALAKRHVGDRYEVLEAIGAGGYAAVLRVKNRANGRHEALKIAAVAPGADPDALQRFREETQIAAALDHPSIVSVYASGDDGEVLWYAMELVEGPNLAAGRGRVHGDDEAARVAEALLDALAYSHARGVLHRDVKPENVLLAADGRPKLTDFGIAKSADSSVRTKTGFLVGSPAYVSPEQLSGDPLDGRTDVYSLGTVLFELLAGRLPFRSRGIEDLARRLDDEAPPLSRFRADADRDLERIVGKALARDRRKRYDAAGMRDDLRRWLARREGGPGETPVPPPPRISDRRLGRAALIAALVLTAAVVALLLAR